MVSDPTVGDGGPCATCHPIIAAASQNSLHSTLAGIRQSFIDRSGGAGMPAALQPAFDNSCARCHSSCGDCHLSVPNAAGGGLLSGHRMRKTPPMNLVCTACHGSRVSDEYKGGNPGISADVHYSKGMQCVGCHTGAEMHGVGEAGATHRYDITSAPQCADCHPDDAAFKTITEHVLHRETDGSMKLGCQVCHSTTYKNCSSCHVSLDGEGRAIYEVNAPSHESLMTFKIGYNPRRDALHPAKFVTLRHVPIDPDNYAFYGANLLTDFDARPTWRLATPHNIQRITPQSESCTASCHGQRELFLGPDDLAPYEVTANAGVVVPDVDLP